MLSMMKSIILLVFLELVSSKILNNEYQKQSPRQIYTPKMLWSGCGPVDGKCGKCLVVAFESGNDVACLDQKYSETECILEGNFLTGGARVFVSSEQCLNGGDMDNIQVSFEDSRCPDAAMFEVDTKSGISTSERKMPVDMVDEVMWPEILGDQKRSQNNDTPPFPENGFKLNLAIRYDNLFAAQFPGTEEIRIKAAMGHVQMMYQWTSLRAKMCLNMSIAAYDGSLTPSTSDLISLGADIIFNESEEPNLFVFITQGESKRKGTGYRGSVCAKEKGWRLSINSWVSGDFQLAKTVAKEIGRNLGMKYDFAKKPGNLRTCPTGGSSCTDIGGVLDYSGTVNKWSCCSNADFRAKYATLGPNFCLEACTDAPGTMTTPTSTTAPTSTQGTSTSTCKSFQFDCKAAGCTNPDNKKCRGTCIPKNWANNGEKQCADGSDEGTIVTCDAPRHCCQNGDQGCEGRCIPESWINDGDEDCDDGSDEKKVCRTSTDCFGNLQCGSFNCGPNFPTSFDCCYVP